MRSDGQGGQRRFVYKALDVSRREFSISSVDPLALALTPGVGPKRLMLALERTDLGPEALGPEIARAYRKVLESGRAEQEREKAQALGVRIIGLWDPEYPPPLRHLAAPPSVLYLRGSLPDPSRSVAIVGTRRASAWAKTWTRKVARELAEAGVGVISGLALGIDAEAHAGALEGGGYTLGVLGSAVDQVYPTANQKLAEKISLLSEFPLGTRPKAEFFPRRNRIVAGLSRAVIVAEAGAKSGALITAKFALEQGIDVLAVPGRPGDVFSEGCNRLIQDGAALVMGTEDILMVLGLTAPRKDAVALEGKEAQVYRTLLEMGEALPDDLALSLDLPLSEVLAALTLLELKGYALGLPGGRYAAG